jgi:hypothetical protein
MKPHKPQPPRLPPFRVGKIIEESELPGADEPRDEPEDKWAADWHKWAREQLPPEPPDEPQP